MGKPYFIYVTEDVAEEATAIVEKIKDVGHRGSAVFIIGEDADAKKLRDEMNRVLDKGYKAFVVVLGYPQADAGLAIQIGQAAKYANTDESIAKLVKDLGETHIDAPKYMKWVIIVAVIVVSALIVVLIAKLLGLGVFK